ncbi:hypothetical protein PRIPAC_97898 [Pristionchus pacificus]|uniref:Nuclear receptor domain-containing protein n=1 Tax=Pristionchus pacificus TaxID=54126 RepID=A0A8R1V573_PRIPA|nr:hypothetical protein PRIPAC_97898 [Pristionchus pacificus]
MKVDCLVCGKPTSATHMGMDACRACTVFYKRNYRKRDKLKCGYGKRVCMDDTRNNVFNCRKCRIERFEMVMRSGGIDTSPSSSPPLLLENKNNNNNNISVKSLQIIKSSPQTSNGPSIIEKIRANHQALSAFRRTSELNLRGIEIDPADASDDKYDLIPSSYRQMNEGMKVLVVGLFEFASSTFPEFRGYSFATNHRCFFWMDAALRSLRRFGKRFDVLYGSYTTKISLDTIDDFFADCPDPSTVSAAAKAFRNRWHENVPKLRALIRKVSPTDDEFLAIIGLAFWSFEGLQTSDYLEELGVRYRAEITTSLSDHYRATIGVEKGAIRILQESLDVSDEVISLAARYRTTIISELTAHYRSTIGETKGAARLGSMICLAPDMKVGIIDQFRLMNTPSEALDAIEIGF